MQYPIIDLIADAYLNNGWTGLDISTGKNLWDDSVVISSTFEHINNTWSNSQTDTRSSNQFRIRIRKSGTNILSTNLNYVTIGINTVSFTVDSDFDAIQFVAHNGQTRDLILNNNNITGDPGTYTFSFNCLSNDPTVVNGYIINKIQVETGSEATPYEPYGSGANDFPNRLKLPLPHYFPHPVIDALQRAAAGTQTADDTEILRHYLTPLGIGGI